MVQVEKIVLIEQFVQCMFELVDCCEDYFVFLFWCSQIEVKFCDVQKIVVMLYINYYLVKFSFIMENDKEYLLLMNICLVDGFFCKFEGFWYFRLFVENVCKIEFKLYYEFFSKLFEKVIGLVFSYIVNIFVDVFVCCVVQVYGVSYG